MQRNGLVTLNIANMTYDASPSLDCTTDQTILTVYKHRIVCLSYYLQPDLWIAVGSVATHFPGPTSAQLLS